MKTFLTIFLTITFIISIVVLFNLKFYEEESNIQQEQAFQDFEKSMDTKGITIEKENPTDYKFLVTSIISILSIVMTILMNITDIIKNIIKFRNSKKEKTE
jgi:preprotein translocase subunit SecG